MKDFKHIEQQKRRLIEYIRDVEYCNRIAIVYRQNALAARDKAREIQREIYEWWQEAGLKDQEKFLDVCNGLGSPAIEIIPGVE